MVSETLHFCSELMRLIAQQAMKALNLIFTISFFTKSTVNFTHENGSSLSLFTETVPKFNIRPTKLGNVRNCSLSMTYY
jgi:hypothetical protein